MDAKETKAIMDRAYRMLQRPDTYRTPAWAKLVRDLLELRMDERAFRATYNADDPCDGAV